MKKIYSGLLALILVLSPSILSAKESSNIRSMSVTSNELETVVKKALKRFNFSESLNDQRYVIPLYDVNEEVVAYYYQFTSHYLVVSASKEYSPVLLAGKGKLYITELNNSEKVYYIGGIIGVKAKSGEDIVDNLNKKEKNKKYKKENLKLNKNPEAVKSWEKYLSVNGTIGTMALSEEIISIRAFNQWDNDVDWSNSSCGPTTAAAISEYWRNKKSKSRIDGMDVFATEGEMINHFYNSHGGSIWGWSTSQLGYAIRDHAEEANYTVNRSTFNSFTTYKSEINNARPVAVKFDEWTTFFEPDADYAYDYHWTVGKGYSYDSSYGDKYIIINNNVADYTSDQEQYIDYSTNDDIISMVSITIN